VVKSIAIYVEGGGDTAQTLEPFRRGMSQFLKPIVQAVRDRRIRWRVVPCGGRQQAYEAFVDAIEKEPDVFNVLLVDSEEPVAFSVGPWDHLKSRAGDEWDRPAGVDDACCQMMVACMEAWFLADPETLARHFGNGFDRKKLPAADLAESRTKQAIEEALRKSTRNTKATEYKKIRDGARLLEKLDSATVRQRCQWCERLFTDLRVAIGAQR
jgi:hypothetical protein